MSGDIAFFLSLPLILKRSALFIRKYFKRVGVMLGGVDLVERGGTLGKRRGGSLRHQVGLEVAIACFRRKIVCFRREALNHLMDGERFDDISGMRVLDGGNKKFIQRGGFVAKLHVEFA